MEAVKLLPWDAWGIIEARDGDLTADDLALLDQVAGLVGGPTRGSSRLRHRGEVGSRPPGHKGSAEYVAWTEVDGLWTGGVRS